MKYADLNKFKDLQKLIKLTGDRAKLDQKQMTLTLYIKMWKVIL
jgi:hypothetical protein